DFEVNLHTTTFGEAQRETVEHAPGYFEHRFPKTRRYNQLHHTMDRVAGFAECSGLVSSLACRSHPDLREAADRVARECDLFVHESVFLARLTPKRRRRGQVLVYDAYNVETRMARDMFGRSIQGRLATRHIHNVEKHLLREAD